MSDGTNCPGCGAKFAREEGRILERETVKRARELWQREGEIEIDDDASVSRGEDNGAYVEAWVWVPDKETEEDGR